MSTRATYTFYHPWRKPVTLYVHYDGYPEGATSLYFAPMLQAKGRTLAERFIRSVEDAEITDGHNAHADTEYRYDLIEDRTGHVGVVAWKASYKRTDDDRWSKEWTPFYAGTLTDFLAKYQE